MTLPSQATWGTLSTNRSSNLRTIHPVVLSYNVHKYQKQSREKHMHKYLPKLRNMHSAESGLHWYQIRRVLGPWASPCGANWWMLKSYRYRQFYRNSNGENMFNSFRDMRFKVCISQPHTCMQAWSGVTISLHLEGLRHKDDQNIIFSTAVTLTIDPWPVAHDLEKLSTRDTTTSNVCTKLENNPCAF